MNNDILDFDNGDWTIGSYAKSINRIILLIETLKLILSFKTNSIKNIIPLDVDWYWCILIDADCCWLMMRDADCHWLILIERHQRLTPEKNYTCRSAPTSLGRADVIFKPFLSSLSTQVSSLREAPAKKIKTSVIKFYGLKSEKHPKYTVFRPIIF